NRHERCRQDEKNYRAKNIHRSFYGSVSPSHCRTRALSNGFRLRSGKGRQLQSPAIALKAGFAVPESRARSESTIISTISLKLTSGLQHRILFALLESPHSVLPSLARTSPASISTCLRQSRPA